jgi:hypothetical protein
MRQTRHLKMQRCEETLGERDVGGYTARAGGSFPALARSYLISVCRGVILNGLSSSVADGGQDGWLALLKDKDTWVIVDAWVDG